MGQIQPAIVVSNKLGFGVGFGEICFGYSLYGDNMELAGIYRRGGGARPKGTDRMRHYAPTNPQTISQQANRTTFSDAVLAWQNLTSNEKENYNERASRMRRRGYNLFISEYMQAN